MKVIISENQLGLIRRISEIERLIDPTMDGVYSILQGGNPSPLEKRLYRPFESTVVMKLSNDLVNKTKLIGDEKVTLRNQIQRYITNEYYTKIRDYFMSRLEKNITESNSEKQSNLIYKMYNDGMNFNEISELIGLNEFQIVKLLKDKDLRINCDLAYKIISIIYKTDLINKGFNFNNGQMELVTNWDSFGGFIAFEYDDKDYKLMGMATPYWDGNCTTPVDGSYFENKKTGHYIDVYDNSGIQLNNTPRHFNSIQELIDFLNNDYPKQLIKPTQELISYYKDLKHTKM
jgi:hypothetical protein